MKNLSGAKRPFQVAFLGWMFIVVGSLSSIYHVAKNPLDRWTLPIVLVGVIAVVAGVYLLRGARWSRWLLLIWLTFHVVISAFNSLPDAIVHAALLLVIGYFLLGPPTREYFQPAQSE